MASEKDQAYFTRIAEQNRKLRDTPATSLQDSLDALNKVSTSLGLLAENRVSDGDGDLQSHLSYLKRLRLLDPNYRVTRS
jgi:hypothetical protein